MIGIQGLSPSGVEAGFEPLGSIDDTSATCCWGRRSSPLAEPAVSGYHGERGQYGHPFPDGE